MLSSAAQQRAITHPPASFFPTTFPNLYATPDNPNPPAPPPPNPSPQSQDSGVVTSLALDDEWVVVGLASSRIHIFSARSGVLARTLIGHESGVWGVCLVSRSKKGSDTGKGKARATGVEEPFQWMSIGAKDDPSMPLEAPGLARELPSTWRVALGLESAVGNVSRSHVIDEDAEETLLSSRFPVPPHDSVEKSSSLPNLQASTLQSLTPHSTANRANTSRPITQPYVPDQQSSPCFSSEGWGQPNALVISGGCDKVVRVWDVISGLVFFNPLRAKIGY